MKETDYQKYKIEQAREQKRKKYLFRGKGSLLAGAFLLLLTLYTIPFHAVNVSEICGEELRERKAYYIEDLQILQAKVDDTEDQVYCVAKFFDRDQKAWILSFDPGTNEHLAEQIRLAQVLGKELDATTSGYVYVENIPDEARVFYSSHSEEYAEADGGNVLKLNAYYLCGASGNYTLQTLMRPGEIKAGFVVGVVGIIFGGVLVITNRPRKVTEL